MRMMRMTRMLRGSHPGRGRVVGLCAFALTSLMGIMGDAAGQGCPGGGTGCLTEDGTQPLPPLLNSLLPPSNCAGCHADYDAANDIEPSNTWAGSMMSQATRDPVFWAALDVANNDVPEAGRLCLRCHTPQAAHRLRRGAADVDSSRGPGRLWQCGVGIRRLRLDPGRAHPGFAGQDLLGRTGNLERGVLSV